MIIIIIMIIINTTTKTYPTEIGIVKGSPMAMIP